MDDLLKASLWRQFGAAIDYLEDNIDDCPDALWHACLWTHPGEKPELSQVWYRVYHTLFWLDIYMTGSEEGFLPPAPFTLIEQDDDGPLPERPYTKDELRGYLDYGRRKCRATIESLTDKSAWRRCVFPWGEVSFLEMLLLNMRHVQEHSGQLNLMLGQNGVATADYPTQFRRPFP